MCKTHRVSKEHPEHLNQKQSQLSMTTKNALGLTVVYRPEHCKPTVDIIFIHGLGGRSHYTWSYKKDLERFFPSWLCQEPGLAEVRISTYGYDSSIWPALTRNFSCIEDFSQELLARVKVAANGLAGETPFGEIPIIMVAHSLGGLVAEQACNIGIKDLQYQSLIDAAFAMIFLATPHHGSEVADFVDSAIQRMGLGFFSKPYIRELRSDSSVLSEIDRGFRQNLPRMNIVSFCETRGMIPLTRLMVVKKTSAVLGYPGEMIVPLNTDHHMICKYRSRRDANYAAFLHVVRRLIVNVTRSAFRGKHWSQRINLVLDREGFGSLPALPTLPRGSCEWIFSDPIFSSWLHAQEKRPTALWLRGPPGSGKSVLSTFIAQHISLKPSYNYCFFSAPPASAGSLSPDVLLRSLSHQLSAKLPATKYIPTLTGQQITFDCSSWYTFWRLLIETLLSIGLDTETFLIIDGMDRFHDPGSFLAALEEYATVCLPLRLFVASEATQPAGLSNKLKGKLGLHTLDLRHLDGVKNDLRRVVTEKVENLRGLDGIKSDITTHILNISDGNFLCADLLYKEIKNCRRKERLKDILQRPPRGVTSFYEAMEAELKYGWSTEVQEDAQVLMPWILYSFAPLKIDQLHHGLQYLGVGFIDIESAINNRICGRFVTVNNKREVTLIHPTARRFILDQPSVLSADQRSAHHSIFTSCILCLNAFTTTNSRREEEFGPFLAYAMKFWFRHLEKCEIDGDSWILSSLVAFFRDQGILSWIFLVFGHQEPQYLISAALSINRFVAQPRNTILTPAETQFLERCSIDLYMLVERFSKPLLGNPELIFGLVPSFCPANSFIRPLAQFSNISVSGFPFSEWDSYLASFTIGDGYRGTGITNTRDKFAIATSTQEGLVLVYNLPKRNSNFELIHGERVMTVQFDRAGNKLATYGPTTTILWDLTTKQPSQTFSNTPNTSVLAFAFAQDDSAIFMFSDDYILRKATLNSTSCDWDAIDLGARRGSVNHWMNPSCAVFDHQSNFLAVGFRDDPIEVWDLQSLVCIARLESSTCPQTDIIQLCWCPDSDRIIARQMNGSLTILDLRSHEPIQTCIDTVSTMSCNATSEFLVTGDMAGTVKFRKITDLTLLYQARRIESSVGALSVAPTSGKIYCIQSSKCTTWEPPLLAASVYNQRSQNPPFPLGHRPQEPDPNQDYYFVTSLAACARSPVYCGGYTNGKVRVILNGGVELPLELPTRVRIEHLLWSPDDQYLAVADIGARLFIMSLDHERQQFKQLTSFKLKWPVEQILFQRASEALLVVTKDHIVTWEFGTQHKKQSLHSLGSHSRWVNHPTNDDLILGIGPDSIQTCQWHDLTTVSRISLNNSISDLTFGLELLDYVKSESSRAELHPTSAMRQVKRALSSPDASMLLLVTARQTESINGSQFLQVPVTELDNTITQSHGVLCPTPLIESLSDVITMPLGFLSSNSGQEARQKSRGAYLVFLSKDNWVCSTWLDPSSENHPVRRHIFLPDDWLTEENVELIQLCSNGIYIPRSEHIIVIRNIFDAWF